MGNIDQLKKDARTGMHQALAAMHLQLLALIKEGRGDHAPADKLRRDIRELEDLLRKS